MTIENDSLREVLKDVIKERQRQDNKWGPQNHSVDHWCVIEMEELGEVARAAFEHDYENYRKECIEVAAVAIAMVESFDRNEGKHMNINKSTII